MKKFFACLAAVFFSALAMADDVKPFNLSLTPDVAIYPRTDTIEGLTLSIWGENQQRSLALGIANGTLGHSAGLCLGILNYADSYKGLQLGILNYTKEDSTGWGGGLFFGFVASVVNYTGGTMKGVFTGVVNYTGNLKGVDLGIVNYAEDATGIQIGIINIIHKNKSWFGNLPGELAPTMILVNWRF